MFIERAEVEDAKEILDLQKLAYKSEADLYSDYTIPPLTQAIEEIRLDFENQVFLKTSSNGKIIGSVRAELRQETCLIGRLIVHPDFQNRGIGTKLMNEIESYFIKAKRFELFTGYRSERNIYLYQKLGYKIFRKQKINDNFELVYMEKFNKTT